VGIGNILEKGWLASSAIPSRNPGHRVKFQDGMIFRHSFQSHFEGLKAAENHS